MFWIRYFSKEQKNLLFSLIWRQKWTTLNIRDGKCPFGKTKAGGTERKHLCVPGGSICKEPNCCETINKKKIWNIERKVLFPKRIVLKRWKKKYIGSFREMCRSKWYVFQKEKHSKENLKGSKKKLGRTELNQFEKNGSVEYILKLLLCNSFKIKYFSMKIFSKWVVLFFISICDMHKRKHFIFILSINKWIYDVIKLL